MSEFNYYYYYYLIAAIFKHNVDIWSVFKRTIVFHNIFVIETLLKFNFLVQLEKENNRLDEVLLNFLFVDRDNSLFK